VAVAVGEMRGSLLGVTLDTGGLGRLRLGLTRAAVVRTGLTGHDLRCRPRRSVRPRRNDVLNSAAAGAGSKQCCDHEYRDDRHARLPRAAPIQALQWGQIRTAARASGAADPMLGDTAGRPPCHAAWRMSRKSGNQFFRQGASANAQQSAWRLCYLATQARMTLAAAPCRCGRKVAWLSASKVKVPPGLIA